MVTCVCFLVGAGVMNEDKAGGTQMQLMGVGSVIQRLVVVGMELVIGLGKWGGLFREKCRVGGLAWCPYMEWTRLGIMVQNG